MDLAALLSFRCPGYFFMVPKAYFLGRATIFPNILFPIVLFGFPPFSISTIMDLTALLSFRCPGYFFMARNAYFLGWATIFPNILFPISFVWFSTIFNTNHYGFDCTAFIPLPGYFFMVPKAYFLGWATIWFCRIMDSFVLLLAAGCNPISYFISFHFFCY